MPAKQSRSIAINGAAAAACSLWLAGAAMAGIKPEDHDAGTDGILYPVEIGRWEAAVLADKDPDTQPIRDHYLVQIAKHQNQNGPDAPLLLSSIQVYPKGLDCTPVRRVILRSSVLDAPLTGCAPLAPFGSGATFSFSRDGLTDINTIAFSGALLFPLGPVPRRHSGSREAARTARGLSEAGYAFFIEGNGTSSSGQPTTGTVRAGFKADWAFAGGGYDQILLTSAVYAQSDFDLDGRAYGLQLAVTPQAVDRKLNGTSSFSRRVKAGEKFSDHYFTVNGVLDAFHVDEAGETGLTAGDDYAWLGGTLGYTYFNNKQVASGLTLDAKLDAFTDLANNEDAVLFTGTIGFALNEEGTAAIALKYEKGRSRQSFQKVDSFSLAYQVRF
ncbi:hypothetical protein AB838_07795 [Rhodobacteraceae bacterium (ex Bugula neritina AB1)]|nr:hypothetical protein AB838_07795 [Rhodobacteraceae bacterium (ex Bugula neritina AB1)]